MDELSNIIPSSPQLQFCQIMLGFSDSKNIFLGISSKADGNMRLFDNSGDSLILKNREKFFSKIGFNNENVISANLMHADRVAKVGLSDRGKIILDCDALITNQPGIILTITVADCLPIYFYDSVKNVVAIAHAGWRGLSSGIIEKVIRAFVDDYSSDPNNIKAFIGPHIRKCHFEVQEDVVKDFADYQDFIDKTHKIFIDLSSVAKNQLINAGLQITNINTGTECTYCLSDKYFSYRRDKANGLETMIAYIGIK